MFLDTQISKGGVLALGNFDGVHRGHRAVIDATVTRAKSMGIKARVLTFEPHPRTLFHPGGPFFRLTPFPIKEQILRAYGIDEVISLPFTIEFASKTAKEFVEDVLCRTFDAQHVVAGHDFVFGHKRSGTMKDLTLWLSECRVGVTEIIPHKDVHGVPYSSTLIRDYLRAGDPASAAELLGRPWALTGQVIRGAKRGRMIGFPTANIALGEYMRPRFGVYAIYAHRLDDNTLYKGVANIGVRPTIDGHSEMLEAHLFDFDQEIYDQIWAFSPRTFLRPEHKFDSLEALRLQIKNDVENAKNLDLED